MIFRSKIFNNTTKQSYSKIAQHFKDDRADNSFGDKQLYISMMGSSN